MTRRTILGAALLGALATAAACTPDVPLLREDVARLRGAPRIATVYRPNSEPWVDCQPGVNNETEGLTCQIQEQVAAKLVRSSPLDPALATAERFLALARDVPTGLPLGGDVEREGASRPGDPSVPVLRFEATRFSLEGSTWSYRPWIIAQATLLDPASGRILWRASCTHLEPPGGPQASPDALLANDAALYRSMIQEDAQRCAHEILLQFVPSPPTAAARAAVRAGA